MRKEKTERKLTVQRRKFIKREVKSHIGIIIREKEIKGDQRKLFLLLYILVVRRTAGRKGSELSVAESTHLK